MFSEVQYPELVLFLTCFLPLFFWIFFVFVNNCVLLLPSQSTCVLEPQSDNKNFNYGTKKRIWAKSHGEAKSMEIFPSNKALEVKLLPDDLASIAIDLLMFSVC